MYRILNIGVPLLACMLFSGCFSADLTLKVNPDGSGILVEKTALQKQFLEQMKLMMQAVLPPAGKDMKGGNPGLGDIFSEEQVKKRAASYGPGVELISARKFSSDTAEGMEAVYSFKDVSQLRLNPKPDQMIPGVPAQMKSPTPAGMPRTMRFQLLPNGNTLLTLAVPWEKTESAKKRDEPTATPVAPEKGQPSPEQLAQAMQMFRGMRVSLAVEPQGRLVTTNSPYVAGNRVTLFEMDMEEMLNAAADPAAVTRMLSNPPANALDARKLLEQFKGIKVCLEPEVRIEFSK